MADYKAAFLAYMDQNGIKYTDYGDNVCRVSYVGKNIKSVPVLCAFDKNGKNLVQFACYEIQKVSDNKMAQALIVCNSLNVKYRWVKFCIDDDKDIRCEADAVVDLASCGEECMSIVNRIVSITDEAYPEIMRALWS